MDGPLKALAQLREGLERALAFIRIRRKNGTTMEPKLRAQLVEWERHLEGLLGETVAAAQSGLAATPMLVAGLLGRSGQALWAFTQFAHRTLGGVGQMAMEGAKEGAQQGAKLAVQGMRGAGNLAEGIREIATHAIEGAGQGVKQGAKGALQGLKNVAAATGGPGQEPAMNEASPWGKILRGKGLKGTPGAEQGMPPGAGQGMEPGIPPEEQGMAPGPELGVPSQGEPSMTPGPELGVPSQGEPSTAPGPELGVPPMEEPEQGRAPWLEQGRAPGTREGRWERMTPRGAQRRAEEQGPYGVPPEVQPGMPGGPTGEDLQGGEEGGPMDPPAAIGEPVPIGGHVLPPLPYAYNALEPYIDEQTMRLHHDKHHRSYVNGLNRAEKALAEARRTGDYALVKHWSRELAFHGSGHYLHSLFWKVMAPRAGGRPSGELARLIDRDFGSFDLFQQHFSKAAQEVEGGGWAILVWAPRARRLQILQAEKHQNLTQQDIIPLLPLDVWEHSYYLKYNDRRPEYIKNWWNVVNWPMVARRLATAVQVQWPPV